MSSESMLIVSIEGGCSGGVIAKVVTVAIEDEARRTLTLVDVGRW